MLLLTGNTISMDSFGPISDNANGIGEMSNLDKNARNVMDDLDAVGNTTKAVTKGIAIGSAVIAAVALFGSFLTDVNKVQAQVGQPLLEGIDVASPVVFIGLLDYARAVSISTTAAQKELVGLGLIAVLVPILVGFVLGVEALGGFLAGIILSGQLMAVFQSNAGGAWDNAKKYIEEGNFGGKHSESHKASVVGDTVGDPLKDTAGPALNPMIKVINLVALIVAPIVVTTNPTSIAVIISMLICLAVLIWAIWQSKREAKQG